MSSGFEKVMLKKAANTKWLVASLISIILKKELHFGYELVDILTTFLRPVFLKIFMKTTFQIIFVDYDVIIHCKNAKKTFLSWQVESWLLFMLKIAFMCLKMQFLRNLS